MTDWNHSTPLVSAGSYAQAMIPLRVEGADPTNPALDSFEQVALSSVMSAAPTNSSLVSFTPSGIDATGRTVQAKLREVAVSVTDFAGCDPTGRTASDAAFQAAFAWATSTRLSWAYGDPIISVMIHVPAGQYLLTQSESIIPSTYTSKTTGFVMVGDDMAQTQIIFAPASGSNILIYNQAFLVCRFENITFVGTGLAQTFYRADETVNSQQGISFRRCLWAGTWGKGVYLTGLNNNSEMIWEQCRGSGQMYQFLYTPPTGGTPSGSDQFLNYTFNDCQFWFGYAPGGTAGTFTGSITGNVLTVSGAVTGTLAPGQTIATPASAQTFGNRIAGQQDRVPILAQLTGTTGGNGTYSVLNCSGTVASGTLANLVNDANSMIDMQTGGHIRFRGCDFSGWNSGTFYQLYGTSHATGVCVFSAKDCRYELHSANVAVIYCEWPQGSVTFDTEDWSPTAYTGGPYWTGTGPLPIAYYINFAGVPGPDYSFSRSQLAGLFSISHASNDFECEKAIRIDRCTHVNLFDIYQMAVFPSGVNEFGAPPIMLEFSRGVGNRMSYYAAWAPLTAYATGQQVTGDGGLSLYTCTTAGTSGAASGSITGSISGTTLTVSATASGTIAVGQKLIGLKGAVVTGNTTSGSQTVAITGITSGMLAVGQSIVGINIPANTTITALGTFTGTSGSVSISSTASGTATGLTLDAYGACILEDTIITAGSGTSWTVNRSQAVLSQVIALKGGPQSAALRIPDGTAAWAYTANNTRNYFFDGNMISPNFPGMPINLKSKKRIAEFGGQLPTNSSGSYGTNEIIIPPNSIITGVYSYAPAGGVASGYFADYLIELDDGTNLLSILPGTPCSAGWAVSTASLMVPVSASMQKRKIKLIAGGAGGGTIDQFNSAARAWVEYVI